MERYTVLTREAIVLREGRQHANADAARAAAAANLQTAQRYNVEADFVESFTLALFLAGAAFGATVVVRWRRGRSNTVRREPDGVGPG
jgi:hypothetical protein